MRRPGRIPHLLQGRILPCGARVWFGQGAKAAAGQLMPRLRRQAARCTNRRTDRQTVRFRFLLLRRLPVRQVRQRVRAQLRRRVRQRVLRQFLRQVLRRLRKRQLLEVRIRQPVRVFQTARTRFRAGVLPEPAFLFRQVRMPVFLPVRTFQTALARFRAGVLPEPAFLFRQVRMPVFLPVLPQLPVWAFQTARVRLGVSLFLAG